jgi:hypothetical protein
MPGAHNVIEEDTVVEDDEADDFDPPAGNSGQNAGGVQPRRMPRVVPLKERLESRLDDFRDFENNFDDLERRVKRTRAAQRQVARERKIEKKEQVMLTASVKEVRGDVRSMVAGARADLVRQKRVALQEASANRAVAIRDRRKLKKEAGRNAARQQKLGGIQQSLLILLHTTGRVSAWQAAIAKRRYDREQDELSEQKDAAAIIVKFYRSGQGGSHTPHRENTMMKLFH